MLLPAIYALSIGGSWTPGARVNPKDLLVNVNFVSDKKPRQCRLAAAALGLLWHACSRSCKKPLSGCFHVLALM